MKIISFAWTTPALLARRKTVTRRDWTDHHARMFKSGELVQAWNKSPRAGGKRVATIELTQAPYQEGWWNIANELEEEGFIYLAYQGVNTAEIAANLALKEGDCWVVRFQLVEFT